MSNPDCPICKDEAPCVHLQERIGPVIHYRIPPGAFRSEVQLARYIGEIMHYAKTSKLPLGSALYEHLQVFLARNELPFDYEYRKAQDQDVGTASAAGGGTDGAGILPSNDAE